MSFSFEVGDYHAPGFEPLLSLLMQIDLHSQLPGKGDSISQLTSTEVCELLSHASVLALGPEQNKKALAYEIVTRLAGVCSDQFPNVIAAADIILARLGNFPGRELLRNRYGRAKDARKVPHMLELERIARELENSIEGPDGTQVTLTDFQYDLFASLDSSPSVSVSAPTSAGKSFILGIDLVRRLRKKRPSIVVYVVPTRALIREVTLSIRDHLRKAGLSNVPVRSVPFPVSPAQAPDGAVFVLTQERLLSLLHSREGKQSITTLIVDEAQNIQDDARGVILQTAIEAVLIRSPEAEIHFASPLAKNPELLLKVAHRSADGISFIETLSPVSQNLILVSDVPRQTKKAQFSMVIGESFLNLGIRDLGVELRGGVFVQRALLATAVTREDESTILYANLPSDTEELAKALTQLIPEESLKHDADIQELIDFIRADVHPDYALIKCLTRGIAYHYGYMPALVRSRIEDLCKAGKLKFICCTSTLLQGVNLPVKHIVIDDPKRGSRRLMERRDFLNLAGRAGRLLKEFHGNVWCLRPSKWKEKSYQGELLQEIGSALDTAMADGGTIIQRVLSDEAEGNEMDFGEAALGKIYCDFIKAGQDLANSVWKTSENAAILADTAAQLGKLNVSLPFDLLDANRTVRPDRLQSLYELFRGQLSLESYLPIRPGMAQSNQRMGTIIQLVLEKFADKHDGRYKFFRMLAMKWIYNVPLRRIIEEHVNYPRPESEQKPLSTTIRNLMHDLEENIRFRLVKYYMAYNSVLEYALRERGQNSVADSLEPFHVYLECGASDRVALNLIALGLSRSTALALMGRVQFPDPSTPEDCLAKLVAINLSSLTIPPLCLREIRDLIGKA